MKIMLDCSPKKIHEYREKYGVDFWQLRTPLTQYALAGVPYGLDNGCFTTFHQDRWERQLEDARINKPKFVCLPDIVGDARRTLELFNLFEVRTYDLPRALVLQDGIGGFDIPWNKVSAVFVGGTDIFKGSDKYPISHEAMFAVKTARILGKHVHVGRVNTSHRIRQWYGLADSIDGSGISMYSHMLEDVLAAIAGTDEPDPKENQMDIVYTQ